MQCIAQSSSVYALFWAAESGHVQIVEMLIQNGANINTKYYKREDIYVDDWYDDDCQLAEMTPLKIAKGKGNKEDVNALITAGARE